MLDTLGPGEYAALWAELKVLGHHQRFDVRRVFFARWAALAPETALEYALQENRESQDSSVISDVLRAWVRTDPAGASARVDQLPENLRASVREKLNRVNRPKVAITDPREALQQMLRNPEAPDAEAVSRIFMEWARTDFPAAARAAVNLPRSRPWASARESGVSNLIRFWARQDPRAAATWIDAQPEADRRSLRRHYLDALLSAKQPELATAYAGALPEGPERRNLVGQVADRLIRADRDKAVAFVESLPAGDLQDLSAFRGFFEHWMKTEPERAAGALRKHLPAIALMPEGAQMMAATQFASILHPWVKQDPAAAGRFVLELPEQARDQALWSVARELCERDAAGAGRWAAALPAGPAREAALRRAAQVWRGTRRQPGDAVARSPSARRRKIRRRRGVRHGGLRDQPGRSARLAAGRAGRAGPYRTAAPGVEHLALQRRTARPPMAGLFPRNHECRTRHARRSGPLTKPMVRPGPGRFALRLRVSRANLRRRRESPPLCHPSPGAVGRLHGGRVAGWLCDGAVRFHFCPAAGSSIS